MHTFGRISLALIVGGAVIVLALVASISSQEGFFSAEELLSRLEGTAQVTATAFLVQDTETGAVLYERRADTVLPIASITKLFTAAVANQSGELETETVIVWQDVVTEGSAGRLGLGQIYTVRELLFPMLLSSSNDASEAAIRVIGRATFREMLEKQYTAAGLTKTTIADASGLSSANQSTASELAAYIKYLATNDRYLIDITRLDSYLGPYGGWINNNPAHAYDGFRGGKHGYTPAAGRTLTALFEIRDRHYTVVLLGSDDIDADLERLFALLP